MSEPPKVNLSKSQRFSKGKKSGYVNIRSLKHQLSSTVKELETSRFQTDPLNLGGPSPDVSQSASPAQGPAAEDAKTGEVDVVIPKNLRDPLSLETKEAPKRRKRRHYSKHGAAKRNRLSVDVTGSKDGTNQNASASSELLSPTLSTDSESSPKRKPLLPDPTSDAEVVPKKTSKRTSSTGEVAKKSTTEVAKKSSGEVAKKSTTEVSKKSIGEVVKKSTSEVAKKSDEHAKTGGQKEGQGKKNNVFRYGNYSGYYGYRMPDGSEDGRIKCFQKDWFVDKDVLDVGCNVGTVTQHISREFGAKTVTGIDIDSALIGKARNYICSVMQSGDYPASFAQIYGPIYHPNQPGFPYNIAFAKTNYVLKSDEELVIVQPQYDVILMLSLTKWVHLNFGDAGLKRVFRRAFAELRPGGFLLLEPQHWDSYKRRSVITPSMRQHYDSIKLRPQDFLTFLREIGFVDPQHLGNAEHKSKGFQRPIYKLTKPLHDDVSKAEDDETMKTEVQDVLGEVITKVSDRMKKREDRIRKRAAKAAAEEAS